jgi:iron(III) transport system substrate-binding protein
LPRSLLSSGVGLAALLLAAALGWPGPLHAADGEVVVYASVDQVYAEPVLREFESRQGVKVKAVYDVEGAKTTGLVNRLLAEKGRPQADVFWNGEFAQTILLKDKGALAAYRSGAARAIPDAVKDPEGYWTGFGGRARVILVNTRLLDPSRYPRSLQDFLSPAWPAPQLGLAYPVFGTTATQAAALYAAWGPDKAREFFTRLKARGVKVVAGNSVVRDLVAQGQLQAGLTDTDDAWGARRRGAPVAVVYPDQEPGGLGTLIIPNTVALIAGAPHPEAGEKFIDYLLSPGVTEKLTAAGWFAMDPGPVTGQTGRPRAMQVDLREVCRFLPQALSELRQIFVD